MVIVHLMGGLGNQLFQYSFGRNIALKNNCELKLDLSSYENYEWHEYSLAPFNLKASIAQPSDIKKLQEKHERLFNKILRKSINKGIVKFNEQSIAFNQQYLQIKAPAFLTGYWQSEKYFMENKSIIANELSIKIPPSDKNQKLLVEIQNCNAVSLHIRRGNYVSVTAFNQVLGTCSLEYYASALDYITERINDPVFYIFSDDIEWAKQNLLSAHKFVFVDINDAKHDYEDVRLMQNCKHNIVANSTFSWWGAWLNNSPDKIIIAPQQWFRGDKNIDSLHLVPENWIRL